MIDVVRTDMDTCVMNALFLELFSSDELANMMENATAISEDCIVIATEDNFFELSANVGEGLDIYCDDHSNNTGRQLTKDEFMSLYKSSPLMETYHTEIDE